MIVRLLFYVLIVIVFPLNAYAATLIEESPCARTAESPKIQGKIEARLRDLIRTADVPLRHKIVTFRYYQLTEGELRQDVGRALRSIVINIDATVLGTEVYSDSEVYRHYGFMKLFLDRGRPQARSPIANLPSVYLVTNEVGYNFFQVDESGRVFAMRVRD